MTTEPLRPAGGAASSRHGRPPTSPARISPVVVVWILLPLLMAALLHARSAPTHAQEAGVSRSRPGRVSVGLTNGASPASFYTVTPCRLVDTRTPSGPAGGPALAANATRTFPVFGLCGVPSSATAIAVNVTAANETGSGHLRVYPAGSALPGTSTINFVPGTTRANNAIVSLGVGGQISVYCHMAAGWTHFVLDVTGFFAAGPARPAITTEDDGKMLVLRTQTPTETVRVGLLKAWGGAITEVSLNGTDYVNDDDPGREIQTSLWDHNSSYGSTWGYNPVEAGDHFYHGSPLLASTLTPDSIYAKTRPIQWAPENFGGGWDVPVPGDADVEKWISVVPGFNRAFKVHYKITHFGADAHANALQELPMMSVNPIVPNFIYYAGDAPWTNGALSRHTMPPVCCDMLHTPELWGAYVDGSGVGIALYTPGQYPNGKGFNAGPALGFTPMCPYSWDPGAVLEFDTFIVVGPVTESRAAIYAIESQQSGQSPLPRSDTATLLAPATS
jgi:hypothetical protein